MDKTVGSPSSSSTPVGGKRKQESPRKFVKKRKKVAEEKEDEPCCSKTHETSADITEEGDNSDARLVICEDEKEILALSKVIDENLEKKAQDHNLTALNVKSILHHLMKNPQVISLLMGGKTSSSEYDIKLTRAKARELVEKGDLDWPTSPLKEPVVKSRTFLDVDYPEEEEEDLDYDPSNDEDIETADNSADESDTASEVNSKCDTPQPISTSRSVTSPFTNVTTPTASVNKKTQFDSERMKPPTTPLVLKKNDSIKRSLQIEFIEDLPSFHTRSKESLESVSIDEFEETLLQVDPEATNLSELSIPPQDSDYFQFLATLNTNEAIDDLLDYDETTNDPEYHYLADQEEPEDEMRMDRATEIPKREVEALLSDLFDIFETNEQQQNSQQTTADSRLSTPDTPALERNSRIVSHTVSIDEVEQADFGCQNWILLANSLPSNAEASRSLATSVFGVDQSDCLIQDDKNVLPRIQHMERIQLENQLRIHVQQLMQTNLLTREEDSFEFEMNISLRMIRELDEQRKARFDESIFNIYNIDAAFDTMMIPPPPTDHLPKMLALSSSGKWWFHKKRLSVIPVSIQLVLAESRAIVAPNLLPTVRASKGFGLSSCNGPHQEEWTGYFYNSEVNLLALGIAQFGGNRRGQNFSYHDFIRENMLPAHSRQTIKTKSHTMITLRGLNIVKIAKQTGAAPDMPRDVTQFDPESVKPPIEWEEELKPNWLKHLTTYYQKQRSNNMNNRPKSKPKRRRKPKSQHLKPGPKSKKEPYGSLLNYLKAHKVKTCDASTMYDTDDFELPAHNDRLIVKRNKRKAGRPRKLNNEGKLVRLSETVDSVANAVSMLSDTTNDLPIPDAVETKIDSAAADSTPTVVVIAEGDGFEGRMSNPQPFGAVESQNMEGDELSANYPESIGDSERTESLASPICSSPVAESPISSICPSPASNPPDSPAAQSPNSPICVSPTEDLPGSPLDTSPAADSTSPLVANSPASESSHVGKSNDKESRISPTGSNPKVFDDGNSSNSKSPLVDIDNIDAAESSNLFRSPDPENLNVEYSPKSPAVIEVNIDGPSREVTPVPPTSTRRRVHFSPMKRSPVKIAPKRSSPVKQAILTLRRIQNSPSKKGLKPLLIRPGKLVEKTPDPPKKRGRKGFRTNPERIIPEWLKTPESTSKDSPDYSDKKSRKRTRAQKEKDGIAAMLNPNEKLILTALANAFHDDTKRALFMHAEKSQRLLKAIKEARDPFDAEKAFPKMVQILLSGQRSMGYIGRLLTLFLSGSDALKLSCPNLHRAHGLAWNILVKITNYLSAAKFPAFSRVLLKSLRSLGVTGSLSDVKGELWKHIDGEPILWDQVRKLFPDEKLGPNEIMPDKFETVTKKSLYLDDDLFEDVRLPDKFKQERIVSTVKGICNCPCHTDSSSDVLHCSSCRLRFTDQLYLMSSCRFFPARAESLDSLCFADPEAIDWPLLTRTLQKQQAAHPLVDQSLASPTSGRHDSSSSDPDNVIGVDELDGNSKIEGFLSYVDRIDNDEISNQTVGNTRSILRKAFQLAFEESQSAMGSTNEPQKKTEFSPGDFESDDEEEDARWTESEDRILLTDLSEADSVDDCLERVLPQMVSRTRNQVKERLELLYSLLLQQANDNGL